MKRAKNRCPVADSYEFAAFMGSLLVGDPCRQSHVDCVEQHAKKIIRRPLRDLDSGRLAHLINIRRKWFYDDGPDAGIDEDDLKRYLDDLVIEDIEFKGPFVFVKTARNGLIRKYVLCAGDPYVLHNQVAIDRM